MRLEPSIRNGLIYCLVFALLASWLAGDFFKNIEIRAYDLHMRNSEILTHPDIVLITADSESIDKIGEWPFSRDLLAKTINYVNQARPSLIATTDLMPEVQEDLGTRHLIALQKKMEIRRKELQESGAESDPILDLLEQELQTALKNIQTDEILADSIVESGNVIFPIELHPVESLSEKEAQMQANKQKYTLANQTNNTIGRNDQRYKIKTPNPLILDAVTHLGHINKVLDSDGVIRRERIFWPVEDYLIPSLSIRIYLQHQKNQLAQDLHAQSFNSEILSVNSNAELIIDDTTLPFPLNGELLSRFYSGNRIELFKEYSFYDVFVEAIPLKEFENKIILFGPTAPGTVSRTKVSSGQNLAPVENLAQVSSSLLNNDWIHRGRNQYWIEALIYLFIAGYLVFIAPKQKVITNIFLALGSIAFLIIFEFGSLEFSYWYKLITPCLFLFFGLSSQTFASLRSKEFDQIKIMRERDKTNLQLGLAFQQQGALDLALEKFLLCSQNNDLLSPLYNLGLEYERKRQFAKSVAVYEYMGKIEPNYLDVDKRLAQSQSMALNSTQQIFSSGSRLTSLLQGDSHIENPRLGRYEIESEIGRGAMSIVYAGRDPSINRVVAIKVQNFLGDDEKQLAKMRERFLTEAKTAGQLNHPDIITIYDVGEEVDLIYIAMEYLKGSALDEYIQSAKLPDFKILSLMTRIAHALAYAHNQKVIHRDIKPSNIIYDEESDNVHLTDFGIARMQDAHLTQTGQVVGTPSYMSPEQITGKRVDHRSDLFSFGATIYQLFTGKLPFQADTMATLLYKITMEAPVPFDAIRPDLPAELGAIINKLLQKQPGERYQSAEELAKALEDCKNSLNNIA